MQPPGSPNTTSTDSCSSDLMRDWAPVSFIEESVSWGGWAVWCRRVRGFGFELFPKKRTTSRWGGSKSAHGKAGALTDKYQRDREPRRMHRASVPDAAGPGNSRNETGLAPRAAEREPAAL